MFVSSSIPKCIPFLFIIIVLFVILGTDDSEATDPITIDGIDYVIENGEAEVTNSDLVYVRIPSTITYEENVYQVTSIRSGAFANKDTLYVLDVPESVSTIGSNIVKGSSFLRYMVLNQNQLPLMSTNSLSVESLCNLYCNFAITVEQLGMYIGSSEISQYNLSLEIPAIVHYKDVVHHADNFVVMPIYSVININCDIPCSHCSLISWTDGNSIFSNGDPYTISQYSVTLTPVLNQPVTTYEYYVDDVLYDSHAVTYHEDAPNVSNPEKEGHSFLLWVSVPPVGDEKRYEAYWTVNSYNISFDTDGGSNKSTLSFQYGSSIDVGEAPTKIGHSFVCWQPELPATMIASDLQVTAIWSVLSFELSFTDRGQDYQNMITFGSPLSVPNFSRDGYHFVLDEELEETMPDHNLHYEVIWVPNQYKVTFLEGSVVKHEYWGDYESEIIFPDLKKEGYHPDWGPVTTIPAENISVYVDWVINKHSLSFILPGGNVDSILEYDSRITAPSPGHREGYYFEGWDPAVPGFMPDRDLTFEPVWRPTVKSGEGADAGSFITGSGDSVIVAPLDLKGYDHVTFGVEGRWTVSFDPSFAGGEGNLKMTLKEVPTDTKSNTPKGTKALYLIEIEDNGKRITSVPSPMEIGIDMDRGKGDPFVSIMEGDDPVPAGEVVYSDGKVSFSTSSLTYMAAGFIVPDDEGFPAMPTAVAIAVMVTIAAVAAVVLFRRERKV